MKGWHLAVAVVVAVIIGYVAGIKYPKTGASLLTKVGI